MSDRQISGPYIDGHTLIPPDWTGVYRDHGDFTTYELLNEHGRHPERGELDKALLAWKANQWQPLARTG